MFRFLHNHPPFYVLIAVDDGTATISCCQWKSTSIASDKEGEKHELGQLVVVQGKISTFREERELTVDHISILKMENIILYYIILYYII